MVSLNGFRLGLGTWAGLAAVVACQALDPLDPPPFESPDAIEGSPASVLVALIPDEGEPSLFAYSGRFDWSQLTAPDGAELFVLVYRDQDLTRLSEEGSRVPLDFEDGFPLPGAETYLRLNRRAEGASWESLGDQAPGQVARIRIRGTAWRPCAETEGCYPSENALAVNSCSPQCAQRLDEEIESPSPPALPEFDAIQCPAGFEVETAVAQVPAALPLEGDQYARNIEMDWCKPREAALDCPMGQVWDPESPSGCTVLATCANAEWFAAIRDRATDLGGRVLYVSTRPEGAPMGPVVPNLEAAAAQATPSDVVALHASGSLPADLAPGAVVGRCPEDVSLTLQEISLSARRIERVRLLLDAPTVETPPAGSIVSNSEVRIERDLRVEEGSHLVFDRVRVASTSEPSPPRTTVAGRLELLRSTWEATGLRVRRGAEAVVRGSLLMPHTENASVSSLEAFEWVAEGTLQVQDSAGSVPLTGAGGDVAVTRSYLFGTVSEPVSSASDPKVLRQRLCVTDGEVRLEQTSLSAYPIRVGGTGTSPRALLRIEAGEDWRCPAVEGGRPRLTLGQSRIALPSWGVEPEEVFPLSGWIWLDHGEVEGSQLFVSGGNLQMDGGRMILRSYVNLGWFSELSRFVLYDGSGMTEQKRHRNLSLGNQVYGGGLTLERVLLRDQEFIRIMGSAEVTLEDAILEFGIPRERRPPLPEPCPNEILCPLSSVCEPIMVGPPPVRNTQINGIRGAFDCGEFERYPAVEERDRRHPYERVDETLYQQAGLVRFERVWVQDDSSGYQQKNSVRVVGANGLEWSDVYLSEPSGRGLLIQGPNQVSLSRVVIEDGTPVGACAFPGIRVEPFPAGSLPATDFPAVTMSNVRMTNMTVGLYMLFPSSEEQPIELDQVLIDRARIALSRPFLSETLSFAEIQDPTEYVVNVAYRDVEALVSASANNACD